jgi:two-component system sensor histidine kinase RstB
MIKAFFKLWLLVFVPLFFLIFPNEYSPLQMFNEYAEKTRYINIYNGTFHLIEEVLENTEKNDWDKKIDDLSTEFGYPLKLKDLAQETLSNNQFRELQSGEFIFINSEPELLLKKIANTNKVISLALYLTKEEELLRASKGTIYLIKQKLAAKNPEQWPKIIDELTSYFHFNLSIEKYIDVELPLDKYKQLQDSKFSWQVSDRSNLTVYTLMPDNKFVLIAKAISISSDSTVILIMLLLMFILFISVSMFMWVYPLWRDLIRLGDTVAEFGEGELKLRADLSKASVIARLGNGFNSMALRLESLIKGQRELTNAIAHDLRTPLYRLRFAFEMLDDEMLTAQDKHKYRQSVSTSIDTLDHLINQTLLLSRYTRATDTVHFSRCKFANKLRQEIEFISQEKSHLQFKVAVEPSLEDKSIHIDPIALIRALNNLIVNACRYASSTISVSFLLSKDKQYYQLIVEDDGDGIDEKHWQLIFQPFAQLGNKQRDLAVGHGLGLAIVKQISQWHKGDIKVSHSKLNGAKFELYWPVHSRGK